MARPDPFALAETLAFAVWNIAVLRDRVPREWLRQVPDPAGDHTSATLEQFGDLLHATDFRRSYGIPHHRYQSLIEGLVRRWDQDLADEFRRHCEDTIPDFPGGSEGFGEYLAETRASLEARIAKEDERRAMRKRERELRSGKAELEELLELRSGKAELEELLELDALVAEADSARNTW